MTMTQTWLPHLFHRRHNTMPRVPMPPLRPPGDRGLPGLLGPDAETDGHLGSFDPAPAFQVVAGADACVLLADLTSPWAYLAHLRLDGSEDDEQDPTVGPVWWAVEAATTLPRSGLRTGGPDRERLREELAAVRDLALDGEDIPDDVPAVLPHPRPVAAAYAEAVTLGRGPQVLDLLLRAYWQDGLDVGDPEVLRRLLPHVLVDDLAPCTGDPRREWGYVVSPAREPLSDAAYHLLGRWQRRWVDLGRPGPLVLVDGSRTRTGADVLGGSVEQRFAA